MHESYVSKFDLRGLVAKGCDGTLNQREQRQLRAVLRSLGLRVLEWITLGPSTVAEAGRDIAIWHVEVTGREEGRITGVLRDADQQTREFVLEAHDDGRDLVTVQEGLDFNLLCAWRGEPAVQAVAAPRETMFFELPAAWRDEDESSPPLSLAADDREPGVVQSATFPDLGFVLETIGHSPRTLKLCLVAKSHLAGSLIIELRFFDRHRQPIDVIDQRTKAAFLPPPALLTLKSTLPSHRSREMQQVLNVLGDPSPQFAEHVWEMPAKKLPGVRYCGFAIRPLTPQEALLTAHEPIPGLCDQIADGAYYVERLVHLNSGEEPRPLEYAFFTTSRQRNERIGEIERSLRDASVFVSANVAAEGLAKAYDKLVSGDDGPLIKPAIGPDTIAYVIGMGINTVRFDRDESRGHFGLANERFGRKAESIDERNEPFQNDDFVDEVIQQLCNPKLLQRIRDFVREATKNEKTWELFELVRFEGMIQAEAARLLGLNDRAAQSALWRTWRYVTGRDLFDDADEKTTEE